VHLFMKSSVRYLKYYLLNRLFYTYYGFEQLVIRAVECRLMAALLRRFPQGEDFAFVADLGFRY
jgi:hypothetical protein